MNGPRRLLSRLRNLRAHGSAPLSALVQLVASELVSEVCSIYVQRPGDILELAATGAEPLFDNWLENMLKTCQDRLVRTVHGLPKGVFFLFPADLLEFTNRASREGADR